MFKIMPHKVPQDAHDNPAEAIGIVFRDGKIIFACVWDQKTYCGFGELELFKPCRKFGSVQHQQSTLLVRLCFFNETPIIFLYSTENTKVIYMVSLSSRQFHQLWDYIVTRKVYGVEVLNLIIVAPMMNSKITRMKFEKLSKPFYLVTIRMWLAEKWRHCLVSLLSGNDYSKDLSENKDLGNIYPHPHLQNTHAQHIY